MNRREILGAATLLGGASLLTPEAVWAAAANARTGDWTLGVADVEADIAPTALTRLHGRAPAALKGTLFRNGPAKFRRPGGGVGHWFDGDGMVRKFQIADGQARMAARFVDTPSGDVTPPPTPRSPPATARRPALAPRWPDPMTPTPPTPR